MTVRTEDSFCYLGPPLEDGPLPALFYFSLSAKDSLTLDPFNQPVAYLSRYPLRIFSLDIPGHGEGLDPLKALSVWAQMLDQGIDVISPFIQLISKTVHDLHERGVLIPHKTAVAGLSRGGFIACHAAAAIPLLNPVLAFAPLTKLSTIKELANFPYDSLDLIHLVDKLTAHQTRVYIGNRDTRVGTRPCFEFVHALTEKAYENRIRSPQVELIMSPSIGHQGHGTSREIFEHGAEWLWRRIHA